MIPLLERFERLNLNAAARIFVVSEVERRISCASESLMKRLSSIPTALIRKVFGPDIGGAATRQELAFQKTKSWPALSAHLGHGMEF